MPFDYYHRLSSRQQQIYRQSDRIEELALPQPELLLHTVVNIETALNNKDQTKVQASSRQLARGITQQLDIPTVKVKVLARRPSDDWGELHGLYEPADNSTSAQITVWMRTAKRKQIVAFKTYLRTLLHEIGHHLDYEYFRLLESYHTEGFYKRENFLYRLLTQTDASALPIQCDWLSIES